LRNRGVWHLINLRQDGDIQAKTACRPQIYRLRRLVAPLFDSNDANFECSWLYNQQVDRAPWHDGRPGTFFQV
jgi:hypothetical protein